MADALKHYSEDKLRAELARRAALRVDPKPRRPVSPSKKRVPQPGNRVIPIFDERTYDLYCDMFMQLGELRDRTKDLPDDAIFNVVANNAYDELRVEVFLSIPPTIEDKEAYNAKEAAAQREYDERMVEHRARLAQWKLDTAEWEKRNGDVK